MDTVQAATTFTDPTNDHGVPDERWDAWDLLQRLVFNLVFTESRAAFYDSGAPPEIKGLTDEERDNVSFISAWVTASKLADAQDIRVAIYHSAQTQRILALAP